ncbi:phage tail assembly chaperone [Martelella mediterranea]|uniref:phage tail assembly chaperone n=1 Tax=Martelella mediterranea TaxID=293089 RepID=UPI0014047EA1|nr:phage tail assembly chaperone [Martelella mediterranea]
MTAERLQWSPPTFWTATALELSMAIDAITGQTKSASPVSRDRIRAIMAEHGSQKSIRNKAEHR